jgi:hypothetical protein
MACEPRVIGVEVDSIGELTRHAGCKNDRYLLSLK